MRLACSFAGSCHILSHPLIQFAETRRSTTGWTPLHHGSPEAAKPRQFKNKNKSSQIKQVEIVKPSNLFFHRNSPFHRLLTANFLGSPLWRPLKWSESSKRYPPQSFGAGHYEIWKTCQCLEEYILIICIYSILQHILVLNMAYSMP